MRKGFVSEGTAPKNPRLLTTEFTLDEGARDGGGMGFLRSGESAWGVLDS
jgi:hypothetical protein